MINHYDLDILMITQWKNVSLEFLGFGMQIESGQNIASTASILFLGFYNYIYIYIYIYKY